ncbi:MAG: hypothetical protein M0000_07710 [Actinomycetota bacterium]|nr:hypothetical protein [Actinomycetota bacterium]
MKVCKRTELPMVLAVFLAVGVLGKVSASPGHVRVPEAKERPTIAVLDFSFGNTNRIEGRERVRTDVLTERLKTALISSRKFDVVERQDLDAVMTELKFGRSSMADHSGKVNSGKLARADYIVQGAISVLEVQTNSRVVPYVEQAKADVVGTIVSDARIMDVERGINVFAGRVETSEKVTIPVASAGEAVTPSEIFYEDLLRAHAEAIASKILEAVFPIRIVDVADGTVFLNRGEGCGLRPGDRLEVLSADGEMVDPDTGETLGAREIPVAVVEIEEVLTKATRARILQGAGSIKRGMVARRPAR